MSNSNPTIPAPAVTDHSATIFVALELSKSTWVMAIHSPAVDKISLYRIGGGDTGALLRQIERARSRAERHCGTPVAVLSCHEAGYDGFWLHRFLETRGIVNEVLDPASIHVNRRARRAKTDRLDAESMIRVLMAYHRGEKRVCSVVRVPSPQEEDARRLNRERGRLVHERVAHVNRIKGLLFGQGIRDFDPLGKYWERRLDCLITGDGRPLPPRLKAELHRECRRLSQVVEMIADVEAERDAWRNAEAADLAPGSADAKMAALIRLKGIGPAFASVLVHEVFHRDFANRRELGAYLGLTPSPYDSGASRREQGVSKAGNSRARTTAVELAWMWIRHQPQSALSRWFEGRVGDMEGRIRRITVVALARKLVVALWRYIEMGLVPEGAVLKG